MTLITTVLPDCSELAIATESTATIVTNLLVSVPNYIIRWRLVSIMNGNLHSSRFHNGTYFRSF